MLTNEYSGPCRTAIVTDYADVGWCIELCCLFDDTIKKDDTFTKYAIMVAQAIADTIIGDIKVTWGKWGARLELAKNKGRSKDGLLLLAGQIVRHPSWIGLSLSTHVFTY